MTQDPTVKNKPLAVVVHGVGEQLRFETLKVFIEGWTKDLELPVTRTRAQIAAELRQRQVVDEPEMPFKLVEINYSLDLDEFAHFGERDSRNWIRSFRNRLREINKQRCTANTPNDFAVIDHVTDDVLFATALTQFIASRFNIQASGIEHAALHFMKQVQLYLDHEPYREKVSETFQSSMERYAANSSSEDRGITLVCHSLGTVVALRGIVDAANTGKQWFTRIDRLITFGSPIDTVLLLFPELFPKFASPQKKKIEWLNYSFGNDPIATDLALARHWASNDSSPFCKDAPEEIDLGPGALTTAHTDYWRESAMYMDIITYSKFTDEEKRNRRLHLRKQSISTIFHVVGLVLAAAVGWLLVVWWEENLKFTDSERATELAGPTAQLVCWVAMTFMVVCHVKCWSAKSKYRPVWLLSCGAISFLLATFLPGLPLLGEELNYCFPSVPYPLIEWWKPGNLVLIIVPLSATLGVFRSGKLDVSTRAKAIVGGLLAVSTVVLSLAVGYRDNPSNASSEFGLLTLTFLLWWLSVLICRIHEVYASFIGGRAHLDYLSSAWGEESTKRHFRCPFLSKETVSALDPNLH
ncbi:hypothetical protein [Anatilimnocola floriformis]|uniref:hypothetical protein n=1 Tax=Anatilimnocola floriformis TaxID=2948575 RepID=UPI0020C22882|nr:hypothetical protein [Anatilimnocola floriformis]